MAGVRVHRESRGRVGVLRLDDGKANAISPAWCRELEAALDEAERGDVRSLVMLGRPGFFSAGLDVKLIPRLPPAEMREAFDVFIAAMARLFLFPKPVVAASPGHAQAGGFILYLASDLRFAVDNEGYRYGLNEVANGVPMIGSNAGICEAAIPPVHRIEILLHARLFGAREGVERGVIHGLAPDEASLEALAIERAEGLAGLDPTAYRVTKRFLRQSVLESAEARSVSLAGELGSGSPLARLERS